MSYNFTIPASTAYFLAIIRSQVMDKDIIRFDNVQVEQKPFTTPYTAATSIASKVLYNLGVNKNSGTMGVWFYTTVDKTSKTIISNEGTSGQLFNIYVDTDNILKLDVRSGITGQIQIVTKSAYKIGVNSWNFVTYK